MNGIPQASSYEKKYQNGIKFRSLCDCLLYTSLELICGKELTIISAMIMLRFCR